MNIRIVRVDTSGIEQQLTRIGDLLENILLATNPMNVLEGYTPSEKEPAERTFYTNEDEEIVAHHLKKFGREYKPYTAKK